jgi:hypothetical protein
MVTTAERDGGFVTHLEAQGARVCELQVMRIGRLAPTDKTWLRSNESQLVFFAERFASRVMVTNWSFELGWVDYRRD